MFRTLGEQLKKPSGTLGKFVARLMDERNRDFYVNIILDLDLKFGDKIYEIGYGPGLGIELLAYSQVGCSIHGIDYSELMFHEASKRNAKLINDGYVHLSYGDFLTAVVDNEKYDKIFCVNVIYFWSDLSKVFKKVYSMLEKDGLFCIFMTPDKEIARYKFAEDFYKHPIGNVETELKNAGFDHVEYKLNKGYYIKAKK